MEYFEAFDGEGNPSDTIRERGFIHSRGLWHRTVHVWVHRGRGEILLQKRAANKDSHPGVWDVSAAGHIAVGETPEQGAVREVHEELGIVVEKRELRFVEQTSRTLVSAKGFFIDREHTSVYLYAYTGDVKELSPDPGEVSELRFIGTAELRQFLEDESKRRLFVPYDTLYYLSIIQLVEDQG